MCEVVCGVCVCLRVYGECVRVCVCGVCEEFVCVCVEWECMRSLCVCGCECV